MSTTESRIAASGLASPLNDRDRRLTVYSVLVSAPTCAFLIGAIVIQPVRVLDPWQELVIWIFALGTLNLLPLPVWRGVTLTPDLPLAVAAAVLFSPATAGLIGFLGTIDRRELTGRVSFSRAIFNRSQQALALILASAIVRVPATAPSDLLRALFLSALALATATAVNFLAVAIGMALLGGISPRTALVQLRLGTTRDFALTWLAWGLMAVLLVLAYDRIGLAAVLLFALLAELGGHMLARSESAMIASAELETKREAIRELSHRISEERADERNRVASHLHDEVLQRLYQVSLMSQVISEDLQSGRLLELDKDVPLLRQASEGAAASLRSVITGIRTSPLGPRGLNSTLRGLARDLQNHSKTAVNVEVEEGLGALNADLQLAVYQVCKEALGNAVRHARATTVQLRLSIEGSMVRLSIEDDGIGFDPQVAYQDHFGLLIMKERAEAAGGLLHVESEGGTGTIVAARFPIRTAGV